MGREVMLKEEARAERRMMVRRKAMPKGKGTAGSRTGWPARGVPIAFGGALAEPGGSDTTALRAGPPYSEDMTDADLEALPGVGRIIREKTHLYFTNGTFNLLDRTREVDAGIRGLLMAGLIPSAVRHLEEKASIKSLDALLAAHRAGTLSLTGIPTRQRNAIKAFLAQQ